LIVIRGVCFLFGLYSLLVIVYVFHVNWSGAAGGAAALWLLLASSVALFASLLCAVQSGKDGRILQIVPLFLGSTLLLFASNTPYIAYLKFFAISATIFFVASVIGGAIRQSRRRFK
jgi:hypothetical protein